LNNRFLAPQLKRCTDRPDYFRAYETFCDLMRVDSNFTSAFRTLRIPYGREFFYQAYVPLNLQPKLAKFTHDSRATYEQTEYFYAKGSMMLTIVASIFVLAAFAAALVKLGRRTLSTMWTRLSRQERLNEETSTDAL
jgi:hypothetical protein